MASGEKLLDRMRRTSAGWSDTDFRRVLDGEDGFEFVREANHGFLYRSTPIAEEHPELEIRKRHAYVLIPRGKELKGYVAEQVIEAIDIHRALRKELEE